MDTLADEGWTREERNPNYEIRDGRYPAPYARPIKIVLHDDTPTLADLWRAYMDAQEVYAHAWTAIQPLRDAENRAFEAWKAEQDRLRDDSWMKDEEKPA